MDWLEGLQLMRRRALNLFGPVGIWLPVTVGLAASSLSPVLIRASEYELSPHATIFHRSWMAALIFIGLEVIKARRRHLPTAHDMEGCPTDWRAEWQSTLRLLLLMGVSFTVAVTSWAWSLTATTVANSSLLHSCIPIFVGFFAWLAFGQCFDSNFWIGTSVAVSGVFVLGISEYSFNPEHLWGDAAALFSAVFFSTEPILAAQLRRRLGTYTIMAWNYGIITVLIAPFLWLLPEASVPVSGRGWLVILVMAIVCQTVGFGLLTYCLKFISAGVMSLLHLLIPLMSASVAWLAFGESLSLSNVLAFFIIIGGIVISIQGESFPEVSPER